ncbi:uncharacterized protein LOC9645196 isoform X1 [Selaginella moellendorffii]|uniref:uncharacterized protein LOC9645196 isoform X1 n=1 Tax=Selaginella moellendorffii TaxID=88036 RepID=UPI000D1CB393|nr:uncharacterized protein LOC9645196 isoform X1 [Selaginella moellendorffii]|eukprot:XP_002991978.2 uncharacterized protein LOC9645196 isoform X1 [Selaginella moellendorffii]
MLGEKMLALSSRDCFLSVRSEDCFSSLLIVTDRGAFSITTVSRRAHHRNAVLAIASHSSEQQHDHRKSSRASAGPTKYDKVASHEEHQGLGAAPLKANSSATTATASTTLQQSSDYLLSAYGWSVRDLNPRKQKDLQDVSLIQAEAFHSPAVVFNDFFYDIFKAEVLTALTYKVRLSPPQRYTCLVAETQDEDDKKMVGVVDLTALDDKDMLQHLQDDYADEYLYVSGLAVDENYRRRNVATALLQGVDLRASLWGFKHLILHAYEDDVRARRVYSKSGYKAVALDPIWASTWIGRRRRVIMTKRVPS